MKVELREYQKQAVSTVVAEAKAGRRRAVVCQPVGSGKTEVMAELCRIAKRPLVIAPLIDLMKQARDRIRLRLDEKVGIEQGAIRAETIEGLKRRVIVGSRDSLLSNDRYLSKAYSDVSLVMIDECHIGMTPRLEGLLRSFEDRGAMIVGFSATPYKGKGKALRYWPRPQVVYSLMDGIHDGYLVPPKCFLSESKAFDLTLVDEVSGSWNKDQLEAVLTAEHFVQEVSSLVLQTHNQKASVVYATNVRQAKLLSEVFDRYGAKHALVHSKQKIPERQDNMKAFLSGDAKIIVNVGILGCGWDHPDLRNIYMAAPTRSLSRYEQRLGRGTRALPGVIHPDMTKEERLAAIAASDKPHFNIYDITDSSGSHQLLNALDVLDAKSRSCAKRRERIGSALSMEGTDAVEAIREADEFEREAKEAELAALKEKRKQLLVGVTFSHDSHDLFSEATTRKRRGWRMVYGKYKGELMCNVPTDYLEWVANGTKKKTPFFEAVRYELKERKKFAKEALSLN